MATIKQEIINAAEPDGSEGPDRKRLRRAEDQGSSDDPNAQVIKLLLANDTLNNENSELKMRIQQLEEALRNRPSIDIGNKVEEMDNWIKKLEKIHDEDIDLLKKSISDLAGKIDGKIDNLSQNVDNLSQKNEKVEKNQQKKLDKMARNIEQNEKDLQKFRQKIQAKIDKSMKAENEKSMKHMDEKFEKFRKQISAKIEKSAKNEEQDGQKKLRRGRPRCPPK
ncbi:hypothetical protein L5515_002537 [Caenorhabditis briggsae]|uniref:Uncharacterized protein n=2 Tax=Caenorhabditis briggsae TaxID=6238 RepID=A0AAE9J4E3_CAEBR|nr:hypothetical protein L5515_002537 [Caenorhabditis briggsae]